MEIDVYYNRGKQFLATARDHSVVTDQPIEEDGTDAGMTPPELFLASLGSCAAYYAMQYLRARHLRAEGLHVRVSGAKGVQPARIAEIELEFDAPLEFDDRIRRGLEASVRTCLIHNTLMLPPRIGIRIRERIEEPVISG